MGISGLMMFCKENRGRVSDRVDLIQLVREARHGCPIEILVDFYAFESYILPLLLKQEFDSTGNHCVRLFGGHYAALDSFIRRFLTTLLDVGIRFVFFIDSSRGSCPNVQAHKLETWKERFEETLSFYRDIGLVCSQRMNVRDLRDKIVRPCLLTVQTLSSIYESGCRIIPCLYGEADSFIGNQLQTRPDAFAVFSHDSDFMAMKGCRLIPNDWFDLNEDLVQFLMGRKKALTSLMVDMVTPEKLAFTLGLKDPALLSEVAILRGNDFTKPFIRNMNLRTHLSLRNFSVASFASWVARVGVIENNDFLWHVTRRDADFRSAVEHTRRFYALTLPVQKPNSLDERLTTIVEEGISGGRYPIIFLAMHHGFYWHREIVVDVSEGVPNVELALKPWRKRLYDLLVPAGQSVLEYFRDTDNSLNSERVVSAGHVTSLKDVVEMKEGDRFDIFVHVFSTTLEEPKAIDEDVLRDWESFDVEERFVVLFLRCFLRASRQPRFQLNVKSCEMDAIMGAVFLARSTMNAGSRPTIIRKLVPSIRCLTLFNWVQEVYLYAYNLFGKALDLSHLFPSPADLFDGTVFVHVFMAATSPGRNLGQMLKRWSDLNIEMLEKHSSLRKAIVRD